MILGRGADPGDVLVDTAAEPGARHTLVASGPAERGAVVERFGELCERPAAAGVMVVLGFLPTFTVGTLAEAVGVVEEVGHPSGAVLVDTLHLARSRGAAATTFDSGYNCGMALSRGLAHAYLVVRELGMPVAETAGPRSGS